MKNNKYDNATLYDSGRNLRQINTDPAHDIHVKWAPDGKKFAFASRRRGELKIWLVPAEGGKPVRFTEESDNTWPAWSPDGKRIAFASKTKANNDIYIKDVK